MEISQKINLGAQLHRGMKIIFVFKKKLNFEKKSDFRKESYQKM